MIEQDVAPTRLLRPYLPRLLLQWLVESPGSRWRDVEGSIVFVDISGFTKMSERLARQGKAGAEEVTDVLGPVFARLLAVAYGNGGGLIKFGGDALLLLFTGTDHAGHAARSAYGMRRELREIGTIATSAGAVTLRMSVGVNSGVFQIFLVGDSHRELVITGPAASETVTMESTASAGEILISPSTAAALPADAVGAAKGPGFLLRRSPSGLGAQVAALDDGLTDGDLAGYVPAAIRAHVMAGGDDPVHRPVTIAFVHFDGIDEMLARDGSAAVAERLDTLVSAAQEAADAHGVTFLGTDIDKDGGKIILAAGTPQALGDDEERMLLTLRSIIVAEPPIPVRIGVNRGPIFAGDIGPSYRRTYTVMGDAVNLAARLMARAQPNQILSTAPVLDASPVEFATEALEPFLVKGKRLPVQAYAVGAIAGARQLDDELPLVGRDGEIETLVTAVDEAWLGRGSSIEIVGEPGIGKTRLMTEARRIGGALPQLTASCELYTAATPYLVVGELLRQAIGCQPGESADRRALRLRESVAKRAPELAPWLPLLGLPLDVVLPQTPEVDDLEDEFRRPRLAAVTAELLRTLVSPALISIEDVHWMDKASAEVMPRLTEEAASAGWVICVSRRDDQTGWVPGEGVVSLQPARLSVEHAQQLIGSATTDQPLLPHARAALAERSGGNPLFLRELLRASGGGGMDELPDSIETMVMAEIDRLPPSDRRVLRLASVLGMSFGDDLIADVLGPQTPIDGSVWRRLSEFITESNGQRRFRHALVRDAAYEGLPFRRRRELHALAGEALERAGDVEEQSNLLAMHYLRAQRYGPAWHYGRMAAERARLRFANVEAAALFSDAIEAAGRAGDVPVFELADALETLGDLEERIGRYDHAMEAFRRAQRLVGGDPVREASLLLLKAWVREREGRFSQALVWISRGMRAINGLHDERADRIRARLLAARASMRQQQGRYREAVRLCHEAIQGAEAAGEPAMVAQAHLMLGWAHTELGLSGGEEHTRQALAIFEEVGDLGKQALALNHLGAMAYYDGRWDEAGTLWQRAESTRLRTGDAVNAAWSTNNIGEILSDQGHLESATERFREAMDVWRAARFENGMPLVIGNLGRAAAREGRTDEALKLLSEARDMAEANNARFLVVETEARIAEAHLFAGDPDAALRSADHVLSRPASETVLQRPLVRRVMAYALMQQRRSEQAGGLIELSMDEARQAGLAYEEALSLAAALDLALLEQRQPDPLVADACVSLLEQLGIVSLPQVPLIERAPATVLVAATSPPSRGQ
jgi:class 3 adenylate cyclase/tetratricopeptide (TPR) repeat protein